MGKFLHGLSYYIYLVYLDDILVHSKAFDEQIENLKQVFDRFKNVNLKLSLNKCKLCQKEVLLLGHKVSENGLSTDPNKIITVKQRPTLKSTKEVRWLTSFHRKFILHYADIAWSLYKLTEQLSSNGKKRLSKVFWNSKECIYHSPNFVFQLNIAL